jgi:catalase
VVDDSTTAWPANRPEVEFGSFELTAVMPNSDAAQNELITDPIPKVDGIETSGDPLVEVRSMVYLLSGRRRRAAAPT